MSCRSKVDRRVGFLRLLRILKKVETPKVIQDVARGENNSGYPAKAAALGGRCGDRSGEDS